MDSANAYKLSKGCTRHFHCFRRLRRPGPVVGGVAVTDSIPCISRRIHMARSIHSHTRRCKDTMITSTNSHSIDIQVMAYVSRVLYPPGGQNYFDEITEYIKQAKDSRDVIITGHRYVLYVCIYNILYLRSVFRNHQPWRLNRKGGWR